MRLPAGLLGVLRVGAVIALPGCDLVESAAAEVQALTAQQAEEAEAEPVAEAESVEPAGDAWPQAEAAEEAPAKIAAAPEGLGADVRSTLERARVVAPAEPAPLSEDPTVVVPFSEDPSRVAPIRPREKTPEVRVRPRVRTRRVAEPVAVAPIIIVEPPRGDDWCPACGRG